MVVEATMEEYISFKINNLYVNVYRGHGLHMGSSIEKEYTWVGMYIM